MTRWPDSKLGGRLWARAGRWQKWYLLCDSGFGIGRNGVGYVNIGAPSWLAWGLGFQIYFKGAIWFHFGPFSFYVAMKLHD